MKDLLTQSLREDILERITPTQEEVDRQHKIISDLTDAISSLALKKGFSYSFIQPQGSTGQKQTQLRGTSDIDLFVGLNPEDYIDILDLPTKLRNEELDRIFDNFVDSWFTPALDGLKAASLQKTYSQHPYLSADYLGNDVDILLCFDLTAEWIAKEGPITAVDRTVHHSEYVASRLTSELRDDIRILKSFIRSCHAYGDTCAVGRMGFTGVALELLAIWEGGFQNAVKALIDLKSKSLDPLKRTFDELVKIPSFKDDHIFIIDPTDTNRNIASSFSKRAYRWITSRAKDLLQDDISNDRILDLIIESPISIVRPPELIEKHLFIHEVQSKKESHYTVVRDKLYRFASRICREVSLERTGEPRFGKVTFEIIFDASRFALGFVVEEPEISKTFTRRGPPSNIPAASNFQATHPDAYLRDDYLWVDRKRKWTSAGRMIEHLLSANLPKNLELLQDRSDIGRRLATILHEIIIPLESFPIKARV